MTTLTQYPTKVRPELGSVVVPMVMGEVAAIGDLCYVADDDLLWQTDADVAASLGGRLLGLIVSGNNNDPDGDVAAGETVGFLIFGPVELGPVGLLGTVQYYASNTKGGIEDAPGTVVRRLGSRITDTKFFFNPTVAAAGS